jgi:integrase
LILRELGLFSGHKQKPKMKNTYKLFQRKKKWYLETITTRKRKSLRTESKEEAEKILKHLNYAKNESALSFVIAKEILRTADSNYALRTWQNVFEGFSNQGSDSTKERKKRAFRRGGRFESIREKLLIETSAEDFDGIIKFGEISTTNYLKQAQTYALDRRWLLEPILNPKQIHTPKRKREPRGITWEEHQRILSHEKNVERANYYRVIFLTGAAQTDAANLRREDFNSQQGILRYNRKKTGRPCSLSIGEELRDLLEWLPNEGFLFPSVQSVGYRQRAQEFRRRTRLLGIAGITLHSYRYAFAERAAEAGIPERLVSGALGHSLAVHRAYAKNALPVCPVFPFQNPKEKSEPKTENEKAA